MRLCENVKMQLLHPRLSTLVWIFNTYMNSGLRDTNHTLQGKTKGKRNRRGLGLHGV